jgi:hypothetical protein
LVSSWSNTRRAGLSAAPALGVVDVADDEPLVAAALVPVPDVVADAPAPFVDAAAPVPVALVDGIAPVVVADDPVPVADVDAPAFDDGDALSGSAADATVATPNAHAMRLEISVRCKARFIVVS